MLLYLASVLLLIYLSHLYVRLRANARTLKARSDFEHLIAGISAQLIDPPLRADRPTASGRGSSSWAGIRASIASMSSCGADDGPDVPAHPELVSRGHRRPGGWPDDALAIRAAWRPEATSVTAASMCRGSGAAARRAAGEARGAASAHGSAFRCGTPATASACWASMRSRAQKRWADEDIALLRTIGEIFASALGRASRPSIDKRRLEARLRHSQRIEALGTLAGGIAHDFNNILAAILGYAEMALETLAADSRTARTCRRSRGPGERARDLVDRILAFSRHSERGARPFADPVAARGDRRPAGGGRCRRRSSCGCSCRARTPSCRATRAGCSRSS